MAVLFPIHDGALPL